MRILFVGDVVGKAGRTAISDHLPGPAVEEVEDQANSDQEQERQDARDDAPIEEATALAGRFRVRGRRELLELGIAGRHDYLA